MTTSLATFWPRTATHPIEVFIDGRSRPLPIDDLPVSGTQS
jgi:hypothetical protein